MNWMEFGAVVLLLLLAFAVYKTAQQETQDIQGEEFRYLSVRDMMGTSEEDEQILHHQ
eukprot:CAMPEP_0181312952 /NCGR_PEP_ID=MMETSP1101-20121128/13980_1 /TAXON_ID=46948 /ORGANISM="Rhodomonas abbreviata, Strain Caron Lab Isolate" /LENGTH=57 /DNA_ID=CAMNT_0023419855 /DNA_START=310 /DNA_END=483 /DNA_ORIENTATION=-